VISYFPDCVKKTQDVSLQFNYEKVKGDFLPVVRFSKVSDMVI